MNQQNDTNKPLVTVAMVTYNSSKYIRTAIESVLASTYKNFELIISDDHSTDNTWGLIGGYTDKRIKSIRQKNNIGEYNNRNYCLKNAKGKYIIYIDGDDLIRPKGLECFITEIEKHPDCGMAISRDYEGQQKISSYECFKNHFLTKNSPLNLALVRVMFNKDCFSRLGGFSNLYRSGDDYARLLMAANYPVLIVQDGLVWWRKSQNSASFKLFNSYDGVSEPLIIKYYFLNSTNLLTKIEKKRAYKKLYISYLNILKSLIRKGEILWTIKLLINYRKIKKNKS